MYKYGYTKLTLVENYQMLTTSDLKVMDISRVDELDIDISYLSCCVFWAGAK